MDAVKKDELCCPKFDPAPWDEKEIVWNNKLFIKDSVLAFFHIPLNLKGKVIKNTGLMQKHMAMPDQFLMLMDERMFSADVYFAVTKEVPEATTIKMSGTFLSKVFEGPYKDAPKWMKAMNAYVASKGKQAQKIFSYYTTCPKCAKAYGKNYVVLLAKVE